MDTMILSGDHAVDGRGIPVRVEGVRELIQRALIRLSVKKGSFGPDPSLGSELYKLPRCRAEARDRVATSYVREALLPVREARVESVSCHMPEPDALIVKTGLVIAGKSYLLEVKAVE